ncbi:Ig-like domain-containing protein [Anaerocellum danielii]|uniref:Ig-like domain-containing protein n=1 Tax=Anaerocellum danielii TaxID=1387557 RepID=A0ABZ0U188_9FIRM|nr:Ig-like domain-containing protein [Caldicellulosiruptor danielii]WPX09232.1 Ig-like domain-containing protein [Caldicellulosiruptor danielii]
MKKIIRRAIILICFLAIVSNFKFTLAAQAKSKIVKIDNLNITVKVGDSFTLPGKVKATLSDKKVVYVPVKWTTNKVSTQNVGKFIFKGKVQNYNKDVILTLNVRHWTLDELKKEKNKVVIVKGYNKEGKAFAYSGILISPDGKVLTNYVAIDYLQKAEVYIGSQKYEVEKVIDYDVSKDIAILKLKNAKKFAICENRRFK